MDPVDPARHGRGWFGGRRKPGNPTDVADSAEPPTPIDQSDSSQALEGTEHHMTQESPGPDSVLDPVDRNNREDPLQDEAPRDSRVESDARAESSEPVAPVVGEPAGSTQAIPPEVSEPADPTPAMPDPGVTDNARGQDRDGGAESGDTDADSPAEQSQGPPAEVEAEAAVEAEQPIIPPDLPRILAIANQKGGVGKTTTSVNLGASLAEMGFRVLVVDLDPQGNATTGLGVNAREVEGSIYDVIMSDAAVEDCIEPTSLKNLFVVPATIDLAGAEIELVPAFSRELKLRRALHEIRDDYDYILIDCPPSLGLLTVNGLAAADDVLVPIQCEYYALEGLSQLIRNVALVRTNLNPTLDVRGIVLTMYDARTKLADQVEQEVRRHFGRTVYLTVIPRTVRLSEAPSFGQPIILFDPTSRGAVAYRELAKEVSNGATRRTG